MVSVEEAEKIILDQIIDFGTELLPFEQSLGRVLAEEIRADRDMPPFNRVTMDGIAINYQSVYNGISTFKIRGIQAAGDTPIQLIEADDCIEIMTGASLPETADTIIRYEDLEMRAGLATLTSNDIKQGQNIHYKGRDKKLDDLVADSGYMIDAALIGFLASVGKSEVMVKKLPKVVILSSGDELVEVKDTPSLYQIRRSNNYTVKAILNKYHIKADMLHLPDQQEIINTQLKYCLEQYDVILLSGGVSMGKFDFIPNELKKLGVEQLFHKVQQRPGKPFWFGKNEQNTLVFAFPGNPVATFMCLHRYFIPWLKKSLHIFNRDPEYAILDSDFSFKLPLTCFLQVSLYQNSDYRLMAKPLEGNGSGDFANLIDTDAFLEMPIQQEDFKTGQVFKVWRF